MRTTVRDLYTEGENEDYLRETLSYQAYIEKKQDENLRDSIWESLGEIVENSAKERGTPFKGLLNRLKRIMFHRRD